MNVETPNFLQSSTWDKMNQLIGAKTVKIDDTLGIIRDAKRGRYLEIPGGPLTDWQNEDAIRQHFAKIRKIAKENHCVFVRVRPELLKTPENLAKLKAAGLKPAPMHLAAEHTVIIDLTQPEEKLLENMRRQTRYEVRRAEKQGITVEKSNSKDAFDEFHQIQLETAHRQNFIPPDHATLHAEREAFGEHATIYKAITSDGQAIAYGLILTDGKEAAYYEAASTDLNRKLPGAYALIWNAIKTLKAQGVERFNLWGIAPAGQPNHRYAGVTTFKTGFGGEIVEYVPAHDLVINPFKYLVNLVVETARKKRRHL